MALVVVKSFQGDAAVPSAALVPGDFHLSPVILCGLICEFLLRCLSHSWVILTVLLAAMMSVHLIVGPMSGGRSGSSWSARVSLWVFLLTVGFVMRSLLVVNTIVCFAGAGGRLCWLFVLCLGRR